MEPRHRSVTARLVHLCPAMRFADLVDRSLGIGDLGGSSLLAGLLAASLAIWYRTMESVSIASVDNKTTETFYWITILFSQTLGTALGDWMADSTGLGYRDDAIVFATGIAIVAAVYLWTKTPRTLLFWIAFVLTRPLGATLGDFLDKPLDYGGLLSAATRPRSFSRSQSSHSSSPCRSEHRHPDRRRLARQRPDLVIPFGGVFNRRRLPPSGRKASRDGRGRLTPGLYRARFCSLGPLTSIRWHRCQSLPAPAGLCSHRLMPCNTSARTQIQLTIRIFKPVNVNLSNSTRTGDAFAGAFARLPP